MEIASEFEDDLFFADLSEQINLLIMDDDDDHHHQPHHPLANCPLLSLQSFSHALIETPAQGRVAYEAQGCKRESKGTGVFIPRSTLPRRKQRQPRSFNSKTHFRHQQQQQHQQIQHSTNIVVSQHVTSDAYAYLNPKFATAFN